MKKLLSLLLVFMLLPTFALGITQKEEATALIDVLDKSEIKPNPKGLHHYLLVCMDSWGANINNLGYSDGMVLLTLDEGTGRVMITSFIRDMLVLHPDGEPGRLTYIAKEYGVPALVETINLHFGINIEKYILMDWSQVQSIVDACGGVKLNVTNAEASYLRRYSISPTSTVPSMANAGEYLFKGHAAVIYMRMRKVVASNGEKQDFGRTFRTRTVLSNIADSLTDISYDDAERLLNSVLDNILYTNLSAAEILEAFNIAFSLKGTKVEQCRLPYDNTVRPYDYYGGAAQLVDFNKNRELYNSFLMESSYVVME
ncbi:MAG: LCP family protein [Eubacteriales bacterium]|nr:LCP family protein [Eubacteriales bacterium]